MLEGLRIVVTRASHQSEDLAVPLRALGAEVIALPVIAILPPQDLAPLRQAAANVNSYDWIVFSSANAVQQFCAALREQGVELRSQIAAVGSATRLAAERLGLRVDLVPDRYVGEALAEAFSTRSPNGKRILLPRAALARDVVPDHLRRLGACVEVVDAYRNGIPPDAERNASTVFRPPLPDWVLFASPSAVENLVRLVGPDILKSSHLASIGPVTSAAIRRLGLVVSIEAEPHTAVGLVDAVVKFAMGS